MIIFIMEVIVVFVKSKQWICKFIVLFLFITGMCFEEVKADPVFVCSISTSQMKSMDDVQIASEAERISVYTENEPEEIEMIVSRSTTNTQQLVSSFGNGRRTLKLSVAIIYVTALGLLLSNSHTRFHIAQLLVCICKTIVVKYIHNTDGKKRV